MTAREKRPCLHKRVHHEHGTRLRYALDSCRCLPCAQANSKYEGARSRARAYGRPTTTWVDAVPARAHVEALQAAGYGWKRVAVLAGVDYSAVSRLIYGRKRENGHQEPPTRRMKPDVVAALLAVPMPTTADLAAAVKVDGTGTRRRLQALVAVGWPLLQLAGRLEMEVGNLCRVNASDGLVYASTHRAVATLYDALWDSTPAPGPGRTRSLNRAAAEGWPPPLAWDDEAIDDPSATPDGVGEDVDLVDQHSVDAVRDGHSMRLTGATLHAAVHEMVAAGYPIDTITARTGADERQVHRLRARAAAPRAKAPTTTRSAA